MSDALGRPDIHGKMIEDHRFAMVVDTNHLAEYRKAKEINDSGGEPDPDELIKSLVGGAGWWPPSQPSKEGTPFQTGS